MLFILPTDTCYGLAWDFTREDYESIYDVKWRSTTKQLAILVRDFEDIKKYVIITDEQILFLKKYPHPWSFLGVRNPHFILPDWMEGSQYEMISLRVAKVCILNYDRSITNYEYPLFLTSANLSGHPEPKTLEEAKMVFPWIEGIDGGLCDQPPSDIFSINESGELKYLRRNYN